MLGAQWVKAQGDKVLARAAEDLLAKLTATVPDNLRALILEPVVATPPRWEEQIEPLDMTQLRLWCRRGLKLDLGYADGEGRQTQRTVWPFLIGYRDAVRMLFAWCELRQDFRSFRIDRIEEAVFREERYPDRPTALKSRWIKMQEAKYRS